MLVEDVKDKLPKDLYEILSKEFKEFRPSQEKAIKAGLLEDKNLLVCTPTASGKTLVGEIALIKTIMEGKGKAIYLAPLKALAQEKFKNFKQKYDGMIRVAQSIGDKDSSDSRLENYDLIICTFEKLDSLIRHNPPWLKYIKTIVVDEIHLLNDNSRGPVVEIVLTIMRNLIKDMQIIGLSATIGNPKELANWLNAELVEDSWRPVKLKKGIFHNDVLEFYD
ncbi:DEAD/DEAH box helicase [Candidatus Woesearchaeota archaeon]|nr:DEAD/DEAH box helicase [Candidatus Woesearchaeota archaeon]